MPIQLMLRYFLGGSIALLAFIFNVLASLGNIPALFLGIWGLYIMTGPIFDGSLWEQMKRIYYES